LEEWKLNNGQIDSYLARNYPNIELPSEKEDEPLNTLLSRFRKCFPTFSRKGLTLEFKNLSNMVFKDGKSRVIGRALGYREFELGLSKAKPEMSALFSERELRRLFEYMDVNETQKVTLFEFVKGMRVSLTLTLTSSLSLTLTLISPQL
jgi:hypothetical protein